MLVTELSNDTVNVVASYPMVKVQTNRGFGVRVKLILISHISDMHCTHTNIAKTKLTSLTILCIARLSYK